MPKKGEADAGYVTASLKMCSPNPTPPAPQGWPDDKPESAKVNMEPKACKHCGTKTDVIIGNCENCGAAL